MKSLDFFRAIFREVTEEHTDLYVRRGPAIRVTLPMGKRDQVLQLSVSVSSTSVILCFVA